MKRFLKNVRDNPLVLSTFVAGLRGARAIGLLRSRRIYSHVPFRGIVTVDCGDQHRFLIHSRGRKIENGLYWDGLFGHEPESMRFWITKAAEADAVLDIGANSGVFALAAAAAGARAVHAFEPLPRMHSILAGNVDLNPSLAIQTWSCAVGADDGTAEIFDPGSSAPTSASLSSEYAFERFGSIPAAEVRVVSIDSFCAERGIQTVDLVKIDVEGYEAQVLQGMRCIVAASTPNILMEVLPGQETVLRQLIEELWPARYDWSPLEEGGDHVSRNVVLTPRESRPAARHSLSGH